MHTACARQPVHVCGARVSRTAVKTKLASQRAKRSAGEKILAEAVIADKAFVPDEKASVKKFSSSSRMLSVRFCCTEFVEVAGRLTYITFPN